MSSLATIRPLVRKDLHDEDAAAYRWTDAVLDRHLQRAVLQYSQSSPLEQKSAVNTVAGTRDISIAALVPRLRVLAIEWPLLQYPRSFVGFSVFGDVLTLDVGSAPSAVEATSIYWHKTHTIHATVDANSTFSVSHDDIIATGGAAYAALDRESFASDRVNVGGDDVWGRYTEFANRRLAQFEKMLRELPAMSRVGVSRMFAGADQSFGSQSTDSGP